MNVRPGTIFEETDTGDWYEVLWMKPVGDHPNNTVLTFKNLDAEDMSTMLEEHNWGVVQCLVGLERPGKHGTPTWRLLSPEDSTYEKWEEKRAVMRKEEHHG